MRGALRTDRGQLVRLARLPLLALLALLLVSPPACRRRSPGTCGEDLDCAPGFDCRGGACVRRERLRFLGAPPAAVDSVEQVDASPPDGAPAAGPPGLPDEGTAETKRDAGAPAKTRQPPPPASPPPPPPSGPEPRWKQRLKNT